MVQTCLDKAGCVVAEQVSNDEALLGWEVELVDACVQELVGGHLLELLGIVLAHLLGVDGKTHGGIEGIVNVQKRKAATEGPPEQGDGVSILVGLVLFLIHPAVEAGNGAQAQLQLQTAVEERAFLVGALVEHIVGGLDGSAVDRGALGGEGGRRCEESRGGGGLGALGVALAVVRVAALEALVGHEGGPCGRGHALVGGGGRGLRGVCAGKSRVKGDLHSSAHPRGFEVGRRCAGR